MTRLDLERNSAGKGQSPSFAACLEGRPIVLGEESANSAADERYQL